MGNIYSNGLRIGSIDSNGKIYGDDGIYYGTIEKNGRIYDYKGNYKGSIDTNGKILDDTGKHLGSIWENGYSYDSNGKYIGLVDKDIVDYIYHNYTNDSSRINKSNVTSQQEKTYKTTTSGIPLPLSSTPGSEGPGFIGNLLLILVLIVVGIICVIAICYTLVMGWPIFFEELINSPSLMEFLTQLLFFALFVIAAIFSIIHSKKDKKFNFFDVWKNTIVNSMLIAGVGYWVLYTIAEGYKFGALLASLFTSFCLSIVSGFITASIAFVISKKVNSII